MTKSSSSSRAGTPGVRLPRVLPHQFGACIGVSWVNTIVVYHRPHHQPPQPPQTPQTPQQPRQPQPPQPPQPPQVRTGCVAPFFCVSSCWSNPHGRFTAARDGADGSTGSARRRRERRLRSWLRHEQQSIAAVLATVTHHSFRKVGTASGVLRNQKTATRSRSLILQCLEVFQIFVLFFARSSWCRGRAVSWVFFALFPAGKKCGFGSAPGVGTECGLHFIHAVRL